MTTITINPSASNHDAWQGTAGAMTLTGEVRVASGIAWGGLLLPSVAVPVGATINSATLYYQASATTHDDPGQTWYAQAADDAGVFTTTTSDISSRPRTTASVADAATGIGNTTYRSVDVTGPLAEVFGRTGWASGNDAALLADNTGGDLWIRSYDGGTGIWYVVIDYTSGMNGAAALTTGAATLSAAGGGDLDKFAAVYRQLAAKLPPDLPVIIEVQGHTDRVPVRGRFPSNWELSTARAQQVVNYLILQGIPPERLAAVGMAEYHPLDPADNAEAYRRNRRIELKITSR